LQQNFICMTENQKSAWLLFGGLALLAVLIPLSKFMGNKKQEKVLADGGYAYVENKSAYEVTLRLFQHDDNGVVEIHRVLAPDERWIVRDSMSAKEVKYFPPKNWLDSAYVIFNDTLQLRYVNGVSHAGKDHPITDHYHWKIDYEVVEPGGKYNKPVYRPIRSYSITAGDYWQAYLNLYDPRVHYKKAKK